jgi:hypothetical protein
MPEGTLTVSVWKSDQARRCSSASPLRRTRQPDAERIHREARDAGDQSQEGGGSECLVRALPLCLGSQRQPAAPAIHLR